MGSLKSYTPGLPKASESTRLSVENASKDEGGERAKRERGGP